MFRNIVFNSSFGLGFHGGDRGGCFPKLVLALQATWLLWQGCLRFLAYVTEEKHKARIEDILTFNEYADVFREDLPSLPSNMVPGMALLLKAPYWMASKELSCGIMVLSNLVYHLGECLFCLLRERTDWWDFAFIPLVGSHDISMRGVIVL
jgi:hypothetical protein